MRRQAEELFYCFYGKFSPWGFAESIIPCGVKEGCLLEKPITDRVTGRDGWHGAKGALWSQISKEDTKKCKDTWQRSQSNQRQGYPGHYYGGKRNFKIQIQRIMQATGRAKAALPLLHAHIGCPNVELPAKLPRHLGKIPLL